MSSAFAASVIFVRKNPMKIQATRLAAAAATTLLALSAFQPAAAQYQGPYRQGQQNNNSFPASGAVDSAGNCIPPTPNSTGTLPQIPSWFVFIPGPGWVDPNSAQGRRGIAEYQTCMGQHNLELQRGAAEAARRNGQNGSNYQNDQYYQNGRDGRNGRNDDRRDAFDAPRDRGQLWQRRYSRVYTTNDDNYYQNCTGSSDPAGVIAGAVLGGLLGNAAGRGNSGATIAGIIVGGAVGGSLTRNLSCEDRSYSYKTYYNAFNAGRANQQYEWRNPTDGRRGVINIGSYYNDPDGFRCTTFSQIIYIQGRPQQARGRACQQPDGVWAIVG